MTHKIIQPGMGIGASGYRLANATAKTGLCIGTISGVGAEQIICRKLQNGDPSGDIRRAFATFPFQRMIEKILNKYFIEGGKDSSKPYRGIEPLTLNPSNDLIELIICCTYAMVWLAKEGHEGYVSMNLLEKIQMPLIYSITGAMMANVNAITMGAGLPFGIPALMEEIASDGIAKYKVAVDGSPSGFIMEFDMQKFFGRKLNLKKPDFIPIITIDRLANLMIARTPPGSIQAFIIENELAAGHSANPRGKLVFNAIGEPVYGPKDQCDFNKMNQLDIPYYIAGGTASPEALKKALELGAAGIQAGSIFALSEESGLIDPYKSEMRKLAYRGELNVLNSALASPTGFPFKVASIDGTISQKEVYEGRTRICSLMYLRTPYLKEDGSYGYRCAAEPVHKYTAKGGKIEDTKDCCCLCNGLFSGIGLGNKNEPPIFTIGKKLDFLKHLMKDENDKYSCLSVIDYLLK
jgi:NAD(P)H-dependent flavin oxidoreductase YrpB (nitropropane dioxygenase family)